MPMPRTRDYDDWTIKRWRVDAPVHAVEFEDVPAIDQAPPLWKDLTLASIVAILLWVAAVAVFA
jgi:hypothetical protein